MMQGKVNAALKMLAKEEIRVHEINEHVMNELKAKNPEQAKESDETQLQGPIYRFLPSYYDVIDK